MIFVEIYRTIEASTDKLLSVKEINPLTIPNALYILLSSMSHGAEGHPNGHKSWQKNRR